jgi:hypothetical protein
LKYKWIKKNIDLNKLTDSIEHFLDHKKFKTLREDSDDSRQVLGSYRTTDRRLMKAVVKVSGSPDNFIVELKAGEQIHPILKLSSLISFLGGGRLLLKGYQSAEFYREIEEEFWKYVESRVLELAGSAKSLS